MVFPQIGMLLCLCLVVICRIARCCRVVVGGMCVDVGVGW